MNTDPDLEDDTLTRICVSMCRKVAAEAERKVTESAQLHRSLCRSRGDDDPTPALLPVRPLLYPW